MLVAHYLAMDVGVVTPLKDGMNLVAKEMLVCNPAAALVLSSGAGTEVQLGAAGFYTPDGEQCYIRVDDIGDEQTLSRLHPSGLDEFTTEVDRALSLLIEGDHFHCGPLSVQPQSMASDLVDFFTDRDGTLKSYSCSYPASIQPAYSAVIQAQFARRCAQFCAIVTTAPLMGILGVSSMPEGYYAYGASAGREWFIDPLHQFKDDSVNSTDLELLDRVFEKVEDLLDCPQYRHFAWIGSGLQKHYGHITVARQDVNLSVPEQQSALLYDTVCRIVSEVDPTSSTLTVREGEFDLKIFTKARLSGRIFNKGHGLRMLERRMDLKMNEGNILVCGDSDSDVSMLEECLACNAPCVFTIWVTTSEMLRDRVRNVCATYGNDHCCFVSSPEALLGAMAQATVREIKLRPVIEHLGDDDDAH